MRSPGMTSCRLAVRTREPGSRQVTGRPAVSTASVHKAWQQVLEKGLTVSKKHSYRWKGHITNRLEIQMK